MLFLEGKNALVTGASYSIGFEITKALSNAGAMTVFNDVIRGNIKKGLATYKENNINVHGYLFDITDGQSTKENIKKIGSDVGIVDILVNNAGIIQHEPILEITVADYRKIIDIDLTGRSIMAKVILPSMIEKGYGKIINTCSMISELGHETVVGYASAKGGSEMLTKSICSEFGEKNIQCDSIGPGYIATPQAALLHEIQPDGSYRPSNRFIIPKAPTGRWDKSDDPAGAAIFLVSGASNFINSHVSYVNDDILAYIGKQPQLYSITTVYTTPNISREAVMFVFDEDTVIEDLGNGVKRKVLAHGGNTMAVEIRFSEGAIGSLYHHQHGQLTYVLSGISEFTISDEVRTVKTSDILYKQPDIMHECRCLGKGVLLGIFTSQYQDSLK